MSLMSELLSGTKPLRGRAVLDVRLPAFDHRTAPAHWGIEGSGSGAAGRRRGPTRGFESGLGRMPTGNAEVGSTASAG